MKINGNSATDFFGNTLENFCDTQMCRDTQFGKHWDSTKLNEIMGCFCCAFFAFCAITKHVLNLECNYVITVKIFFLLKKSNKTCLGRFQDCGRGKSWNFVNLYSKSCNIRVLYRSRWQYNSILVFLSVADVLW